MRRIGRAMAGLKAGISDVKWLGLFLSCLTDGLTHVTGVIGGRIDQLFYFGGTGEASGDIGQEQEGVAIRNGLDRAT